MGPLPRVRGQRGDVHGKQTFFKFGIPRCLGVLQCEVQKKNGNSRGGWCCFFSYFFFGGFIHLNATIRTTGFVMINFFPRNCGKIWANTKVWQCVALIPLKRRFFHSQLLSFYWIQGHTPGRPMHCDRQRSTRGAALWSSPGGGAGAAQRGWGVGPVGPGGPLGLARTLAGRDRAV